VAEVRLNAAEVKSDRRQFSELVKPIWDLDCHSLGEGLE
jgi:hypothetical protein